MIADVVFDLPIGHPFAYAVPADLAVRPGQRVRAPLGGRARTGVVVAVRNGEPRDLRSVERVLESTPILSASALELARWVAAESLSTWGSTLLALVPPPPRRAAEVVAPPLEWHGNGSGSIGADAPDRAEAPPASPGAATRSARLPEVTGGARRAELWTDASRDERLIRELHRGGTALLIAPDLDTAARWAKRLDAARLDSGAPASERRAAWLAAARGRARVVVGSRSAALVPLPPPSTLVLLEEHEAAHKPPGSPRLHARDIVRRRAAIDGSRLVLVSATPSVETWWRADRREIARPEPAPAPWPEIVPSDTRGILRHHPLTLPLTRAIERAGRGGGRVALIVTRGASTLVCGDCGEVPRCPQCRVPLGLQRAERTLCCRVCVRTEPLPDRCPACRGHRLAPLGWDAERVEASVRRRFPKLTVSSTDPSASVMIGPPDLLRGIAPGALDAVGIVALDALLGLPDFRAGERAFALLWAAAEAVGEFGRVIAQTLHASHYALVAAREQARPHFYRHELKFRAELGYPPFRRLARVSVHGPGDAQSRALIEDCRRAVADVAGLTVYPAVPRTADLSPTRWQFAIKGPADLPRVIAEPFRPFLERRRRSGGVVEVEMDPI